MTTDGISRSDNERYVIQQAKLLIHLDPCPNVNADPAWHQAYRDLRTAVAFLESGD